MLGELFATEAKRRGLAGHRHRRLLPRRRAGCARSGCRCSRAARLPRSGTTVSRAAARRAGRAAAASTSRPATSCSATTTGRHRAARADRGRARDGRGDRRAPSGAILAAHARRRALAARPDELRRARRAARPRRGERAGVPVDVDVWHGGWTHAFARRDARRAAARSSPRSSPAPPPGVLSMTGGFPNPTTFPTDVLDEIVARLLRDDARRRAPVHAERGHPERARVPARPPGAAPGPAARAGRADRHQRRHGVHRAALPARCSTRATASPSRRRPTSAR